jgi:hypothetical protein
MIGDVKVQDAPTIVADHEEAVEKAESDRWDGETPVETKARPMRPNHCLWGDHDQSFFPGGPELRGNNPEQFVEQIEPWPWMSTFQNGELLPQREILQYAFPTAAKKANEYSEPEQE